MDQNEWLITLKRQLAFYGFDYFPLTNEESFGLWVEGFSIESAYSVASDVYCGIDFETAYNSVKEN